MDEYTLYLDESKNKERTSDMAARDNREGWNYEYFCDS